MTDIPHRWIPRSTSKGNIEIDASRGVYSNAFLRLLAARGLNTEEEIESFLNPSLSDLHDPFLIPGINKAVSRMKLAIEKKEKVIIFGDYDADGIISAALVFNFLRSMDMHPEIYIPDRVSEGYGLSKAFIRSLCGRVDLIIAVDCGTNNREAQEYVESETGCPDVIACDHHNPTLTKYNSNNRYTVVNPKLPGSDYPFKELSGGGVVFKFIVAMLRSLEKDKKKKFNSDYLNTLLDLVAISTIADLMPLSDENRVLVKKGLDRLQKTSNNGLKALIDISLPEKTRISEYEIGFILAPRLNAAGRVREAIESFRLLSDGGTDNRKIAEELDSCNRERQELQKNTFCEIISKYDPAASLPKKKVFIEYSSEWSEGILGIVSSDLVREFNIPVILFRERDGILKGSGRSIKEFSLHRNLERIKDLFIRFGGHDLACGITMELENFDKFREEMIRIADSELTEADLLKKYRYDTELDFSDINIGLINDIQRLRPFGMGNPGPSFITRGCTICNVRKIQEGKHLKISLQKDGTIFEGMIFNTGSEKNNIKASKQTMDILYDLNINSWMGRDSIQLIIRDMF